MEKLDVVLAAHDLVAVIGRDVPVRLLDISASGCLLQADGRLSDGTTGSLRVEVDGQQYADDVRIVRCREASGSGGPWQLGAEFLWTTRPGQRSLRTVTAKLAPRVSRVGR